jgi:NhaA family Na+:H+ antiporter
MPCAARWIAEMAQTESNHAHEVWGGAALLAATVAAILFVTLGGDATYHRILDFHLSLGFGDWALNKSVHHWINDGLMALFFLLVGIEIKHEFFAGQLRGVRRALPPAVAAMGGFIAPAAIYLAFNLGQPTHQSGWAIPTATDIAFVVALVSVLKPYVPAGLRAFLIALAVIDDLMAVLVIAFFYTDQLIWQNLIIAGLGAMMIIGKNRMGMRKQWVYALLGFVIWLGILKSGIHATLAGVLLGLLLPMDGKPGKRSPAEKMEHLLAPFVRWFVVPVFAFANAGINLNHLSTESLFSPITLGIAVGLFLGKQAGVMLAVAILEITKLGHRPQQTSWVQLYGAACLCGVGFTMALFIGTLALPAFLQADVRTGILLGSLASAIMGSVILWQHKAIRAIFAKD